MGESHWELSSKLAGSNGRYKKPAHLNQGRGFFKCLQFLI